MSKNDAGKLSMRVSNSGKHLIWYLCWRCKFNSARSYFEIIFVISLMPFACAWKWDVSVIPVSGVGARGQCRCNGLTPATSAVQSEQIKHQHPASQPLAAPQSYPFWQQDFLPNTKCMLLVEAPRYSCWGPACYNGNFVFVFTKWMLYLCDL